MTVNIYGNYYKNVGLHGPLHPKSNSDPVQHLTEYNETGLYMS